MKRNLLFLVSLCLSITTFASTVDSIKGRQLFAANCSSCHAIAKEVVGPALMDVDKRRTEAWIIAFVHASQKVIQSGDTAAVRLFESHNRTIMPDHPALSNDDIKSIIAYIKTDGERIKAQPVSASAGDDPKPYLGKSSFLHQFIFLDTEGVQKPLSFSDTGLWVMIALTILILLMVLYLAVTVEGWRVANDKNQKKDNGL